MVVTKTSQSRLGSVDFNDLGFGRIFSDHMFMSSYENGSWKSPRSFRSAISTSLRAYPRFTMVRPSSTASRRIGQRKGRLRSFGRTSIATGSTSRVPVCGIPRVDPDLFMDAVVQLCTIDSAWVPRKRDSFPLHQAVHLRDGQSPWRARFQIIPLHDHHVAGRGLL